jgi:hypothetical protein
MEHDLRSPGLPAWNWHVKAFSGFWDATWRETPSFPTIVAQNPAYWAPKRIAFSAYSVVRELGEEPVFERANPAEAGVRLNRWSPGTNLVFTVESTASLSAPDGKPNPGASWPTTERTWTASNAITDPCFRVIRADGPGNRHARASAKRSQCLIVATENERCPGRHAAGSSARFWTAADLCRFRRGTDQSARGLAQSKTLTRTLRRSPLLNHGDTMRPDQHPRGSRLEIDRDIRHGRRRC